MRVAKRYVTTLSSPSGEQEHPFSEIRESFHQFERIWYLASRLTEVSDYRCASIVDD